jgi:AcrR family transcriptional regulator
VPPRRQYLQTRRAEATAESRTRIVGSARELFLIDGYVGTSMRAVAEAAEIGLRTIYEHFPTKTDLLKVVVETAIVGDSLTLPASERNWFRAVLDEGDPDRQAALLARASTQLHQRTAALFAVARDAATSDPTVASLWRAGKSGHRNDCERFALAFVGPKDKRAVRALTATLYVLIGPETYTLLTDELGFTPAAYEKWLRVQLTTVTRRTG